MSQRMQIAVYANSMLWYSQDVGAQQIVRVEGGLEGKWCVEGYGIELMGWKGGGGL